MKRTIISLFVSFLGVSNCFAGVKLDSKIDNFSSYYLDNGMKVILMPMKSVSNTGVIMTVKVGSKHEGYGETGMAHLLEHMLFKSTPSHKDIKNTLTNLGASWNGNTTPDRTTYYETFYDKDGSKLNKVLSLEAERLSKATFTKSDLDTEMTVVRNELERNENSPTTRLWSSVMRNTFPWHGYGRTTIGERSDIELAPFFYLKSFYKKFYRPDNAFIIVYGNIDKNKVLNLIDKKFGKIKNPTKEKINTWTKEQKPTGTIVTEVQTLEKVGGSIVAWKLPPTLDEDVVAAEIAFIAMSKNPYGKFYKKYVKEEGLITKISTGIMNYKDYSIALLDIGHGYEKDSEAIMKKISSEIESDIDNISEKDFEEAKKEFVNNTKQLLANPEELGVIISDYEVMGSWKIFFDKLETERSVSLSKGKELLKKYLKGINRTAAFLKFVDNKDELTIKDFNEYSPTLSAIEDKKFDFKLKEEDKFKPTVSNLENSISYFKVGNVNVTLLDKKTNNDIVYFNVVRNVGTEESLMNKSKQCLFAPVSPMFGGKNISKEDLSRKIEDLEANVGFNSEGFSGSLPRKNLNEIVKLIMDVLKNPSFDENEFNIQKKKVLAEIESAEKQPAAMIEDRLSEIERFYPLGHPLYKFSLKEKKEMVLNSTVEDAKECYNQFKGTPYGKATFVGNMKKEEISNVLQEFANWKGSENYQKISNDKFEIINKTEVINTQEKPNSVIIKKTYLPIKITDKDFPALRIAIRILGQGSTSRLWKVLREDNGLSYTVNAALDGNYFANKSPIQLYAIAAIKNNKKALELLNKTWNEFVFNGVSDAEVEMAKKKYAEERVLGLSNDEAINGLLIGLANNEKDVSWLKEYDKKIEKLTAREVNQAIDRWLKDLQFITIYNDDISK